MLTVLPRLDCMLLLREHLARLMELVMMMWESVQLLVTRVQRSVLEPCPTVGVQDRETQVSDRSILAI